MYNSIIVFFILLLVNVLHSGESRVIRFPSSFMRNGEAVYRVYLPDAYDASSTEYPVIFLLHGNGDDENSWQPALKILDSLTIQHRIDPAIAVIPRGGRNWWVNGIDSVESMFFRELIPDVEKRFRVKSGAESRWISGYSMGGYGAVRYALFYPECFSGAIVMSPALYEHDPPMESSARSTGAFGNPFDSLIWREKNYPATLPNFLQTDRKLPVFLACGDDDWHHEEGYIYNIEYQLVVLYEKLHKSGGADAEMRIFNGGHNWEVWGPAFREGLLYLFRHRKTR
jgi:enterochelin esterase-like enzyme